MRSFLADRRGNFTMLTALAMLPIMGGIALTVDYTAASSQRQATLRALEAAGVATARHIASGVSNETQIRSYAKSFFEVNLDGYVNPKNVALNMTLPTNEAGGGTLKLSADLTYHPYFYSPFKHMLLATNAGGPDTLHAAASAEIRLKNTLEVSLVLDNSGSMSDPGTGSGQKRIELLKDAAKQLVDTLAFQSTLMKQVEKPVQFSLVPFAASVNVGPQNDNAAWMDTAGLSPVHHENFDWTTISGQNRSAEQRNGTWYKKGSGWGAEDGQALTRFSLYRDMKVVTSHERVAGSERVVCDEYRSNHTCKRNHKEYDYVDTYGPFASWQGCVEARPSPYNVSDDASATDTASLFVPMFGPDEPGNHWRLTQDPDEASPAGYGAANSWWNDDASSGSGRSRLRNMQKYFAPRPTDAPVLSSGRGPNYGCTTGPITELVDVSQAEGLAAIKTAIDGMAPNGGTNVPEGIAWGWRTLSSIEPFTGGRAESERGNDKVIIVLTDGANTYYTPGSLGYSDPADSKSTYSAYGYTKPGYNGTGVARLFMGLSGAIGQYDYSNGNYSNALNEQMSKLCANAKEAKIMVMTVALDLNSGNAAENAQISALRTCSSDSRYRNDATDPSKPAKLFWNATGSNLAEKFKEIADELSNLRIVG